MTLLFFLTSALAGGAVAGGRPPWVSPPEWQKAWRSRRCHVEDFGQMGVVLGGGRGGEQPLSAQRRSGDGVLHGNAQ